MQERFERVVNSVLVIAAVAIAASVAHHEFGARQVAAAPPTTASPVFMKEWQDALPAGIAIGSRDSRVKIVEFADLECPFCGSFHSAVTDVLREQQGRVSLVFVHFPLSIHRFAVQAARAAECAEVQGRFGDLVTLVFAKQDSLGIKSWESFAAELGMKDTASFAKCARDPTPVTRIRAGQVVGERFQIHGTPTVIVNGWRYNAPPSKEELLRVVGALLKGETPFGTTRAGRGN